MKHKYLSILMVVIFAVTNLVASHAYAAQTLSLTDKNGQEITYTEANTLSLAETAIMLDAVDIDTEEVLEAYARMQYCEIFQDYFENDFEWKKISEAIKDDFYKKVQTNQVSTRYYIRSGMAVDRYDFEKNIFPVLRDFQLHRVGDMEVHDSLQEQYCGKQSGHLAIPTFYNMKIQDALNIQSITPISDEATERLGAIPLNRHNQRIVTAVFFFNVIGIEEKAKRTTFGHRLTFTAEIEKVVFYADAALTMPVGELDVTKSSVEE